MFNNRKLLLNDDFFKILSSWLNFNSLGLFWIQFSSSTSNNLGSTKAPTQLILRVMNWRWPFFSKRWCARRTCPRYKTMVCLMVVVLLVLLVGCWLFGFDKVKTWWSFALRTNSQKKSWRTYCWVPKNPVKCGQKMLTPYSKGPFFSWG